MFRTISLMALAVFFFQHALSQDSLVISLENQISSITDDSAKVAMLLRGAWELKYSSPKDAHRFIDDATNLASKNKNVKQVAGSYYYKAIIYYLTSRYDSALSWSDRAREQYESLSDNYGIASIFNLRGLVGEKIGEYEMSISSYQQSLTYASKTKDLYGQSNPLHNIGLIYLETKEYQQSLEYLKKALAIREKIGDSILIAQSYQTIGITYAHVGDTTLSIDFQERAARYFKKKEDWYDLALVFSNLSIIHTARKEYSQSHEMLKEALTLNRKIDNQEGIAKVYVNIAELYNAKRDFKTAEYYGRTAVSLCDSLNMLSEVRRAYEALTFSLEGQNKFKEAFTALKHLRALSDSLLNEEKVNNLNALEVKYAVREKEQQIAVQEAALGQQETQLKYTYILNVALVLLLLFGMSMVLYLRSRHKRQQESLRQQHELSVQEMYLKATLQSQEAERRRVALDLHDGMGQLISSLRLTVAGVEKTIATTERVALVEKAEGILNEMHREIRSIAFNLMPQTLIQYGLVPALEEMAARLNAVSSVVLSISSLELPDRLRDIQEISVYRIVQEWTNNIIKYGTASRIEVQVIRHDDEVTLTIEDDGEGFDRKSLESGKGHGWRNINSRVKLMKGNVDLDTRPQRQGTVLMISFPIGAINRESEAVSGSLRVENR